VAARAGRDSDTRRVQVKRRQINRNQAPVECFSIGIRIICQLSGDIINLRKKGESKEN
jgi:ppGpp synthetase/RelA/SpoT-type nucleotidyltranferase